ncbi:MAG: hypothetical protein HUK22_03320, partial [Thermoguttaceae bacterium]|nr:hypothetical protein [Thermoguttaceae bacterium]
MKIFVGGRAFRNEFSQIARDVREVAARFGAKIVASEDLAIAPARDLRDVDFFLILRSYPGEFSPMAVERLRRAAPLAPIAFIAGALCGGENRTGANFPGTRRFYANEWRQFARKEFFRFFENSSGLFAAPPIATIF